MRPCGSSSREHLSSGPSLSCWTSRGYVDGGCAQLGVEASRFTRQTRPREFLLDLGERVPRQRSCLPRYPWALHVVGGTQSQYQSYARTFTDNGIAYLSESRLDILLHFSRAQATRNPRKARMLLPVEAPIRKVVSPVVRTGQAMPDSIRQRSITVFGKNVLATLSDVRTLV